MEVIIMQFHSIFFVYIPTHIALIQSNAVSANELKMMFTCNYVAIHLTAFWRIIEKPRVSKTTTPRSCRRICILHTAHIIQYYGIDFFVRCFWCCRRLRRWFCCCCFWDTRQTWTCISCHSQNNFYLSSSTVWCLRADKYRMERRKRCPILHVSFNIFLETGADQVSLLFLSFSRAFIVRIHIRCCVSISNHFPSGQPTKPRPTQSNHIYSVEDAIFRIDRKKVLQKMFFGSSV